MRWHVGVEVESPLLLGRGPALKNIQTTLSFIPGGVLRGALAAAVLDGADHKRPGGPGAGAAMAAGFDRVFTGPEAVRFGCLYPIVESLDQALGREARPVPVSARRCKAGGDAAVGAGEHRLVDVARASPMCGAGPPSLICPDCARPRERLRGYLAVAPSGNQYHLVKPEPRAFVRVGLNRYTETAQDDFLFVQEGLAPASEKAPRLSFVGTWTLPDDQDVTLRELLDTYLEPHPDNTGHWRLHLGTARSRGMGQVRLAVREAEATPADDLADRLDRFQTRDVPSGRRLFALTLRAPMCLLDGAGLPTIRPEAAVLTAYGHPVPNDLKLEAVMVETEPWGGWSSAWGLPKPAGMAVAPGGVLVFTAPADERAAVLEFLAQVEAQGLGERCAEGWGEVTACDPFHVAFDAATQQGDSP